MTTMTVFNCLLQVLSNLVVSQKSKPKSVRSWTYFDLE